MPYSKRSRTEVIPAGTGEVDMAPAQKDDDDDAMGWNPIIMMEMLG